MRPSAPRVSYNKTLLLLLENICFGLHEQGLAPHKCHHKRLQTADQETAESSVSQLGLGCGCESVGCGCASCKAIAVLK